MSVSESNLGSTVLPDEGLFAHTRLGEVTSSLQPYGDSIGKLFAWRDDLYRAIRLQHSAFYRGLLEKGVIADLAKRGLLVGCELTDHRIAGYDIVFRHERVPHVVYPSEWCPSMMRDAAVATLDAQLAVMDAGGTIEDAHPWNVVFRKGQPVLVDLTAITPAPANGRWPGEMTFRKEFLRTLALMDAGRTGLAHAMLMTSETEGWELWQLWGSGLAEFWSRVMHKLHLAPTARQRIEKWREKLAVQSTRKLGPPQFTSPVDLIDALRRGGAKSAVIINGLSIALPIALAREGFTTIATGIDAVAAERMYLLARQHRLDLVPAIVDAYSATSTFGTFQRPAGTGAPARLKCDAVIVPGPLVPPRSAEEWIAFDQRVEAASVYARQVVAIELTRGPCDIASLEAVTRRHFENVEHLNGSTTWLVGRLRKGGSHA